MKTIFTIFYIFIAGSITMAQDIQASLDAAQTAYAANKAQEARHNLQQALIDLNVLMGNKVLALMPPTLGGLEANKDADPVLGGTGVAGLMISRSYGSTGKKIELTLANESPLMSVVSSFLSNDLLTGIVASQTGQKRVMVSGYKGMLEKTEGDEEDMVWYTLNVPLDDTLLTFETTGFASESEVLAMAQQLNLPQIAKLLK